MKTNRAHSDEAAFVPVHAWFCSPNVIATQQQRDSGDGLDVTGDEHRGFVPARTALCAGFTDGELKPFMPIDALFKAAGLL